MDFTVVIPSRNRPAMLRRALQSVLDQTHSAVEIIVVNDGSNGEHAIAYQSLADEFDLRARFITLEHTVNGHGPSYAINRGVEAACGKFVCFLDDDDFWVDREHLARAWRALRKDDTDVYFSNQEAYLGDERIDGPIWLEGLEQIIERHDGRDENGFYTATLADLMACPGFGHLNASVIRKSLYLAVGGMDENIRYECEWDLFLRIIESARRIRYYPGITAHHNAPDPAQAASVSTAMSVLQKMLFRSYLLDKALMFTNSPVIRKKARMHKIFTLKRIAEILAAEGKLEQACFYAREARIRAWDIKWRIYILLLLWRARLARVYWSSR